MKMHAGQVDVTVEVVTDLVATQFPEWLHLGVQSVPSSGTVNALFRLGNEIVLRFPLVPSLDSGHRAALAREQALVKRIAPNVPVELPQPVVVGEAGPGYAGPWTAYRWIPGVTAVPEQVGDNAELARDLARFVKSFHAIEADEREWDGHSRGGPLATRDQAVRDALAAGDAFFDVAPVTAAWEGCLETDEPLPSPTWIHGDLMPGNLLMSEGRLTAVIDFGACCVGDSAVDLMPAWNLFDRPARETFRSALGVDAPTWERGRGWAIIQAIVALPYYVETNPAMAATSRRTLNAVVSDAQAAGS